MFISCILIITCRVTIGKISIPKKLVATRNKKNIQILKFQLKVVFALIFGENGVNIINSGEKGNLQLIRKGFVHTFKKMDGCGYQSNMTSRFY